MNFWSYKPPPGRRSVTRDIKNLILEMKRDNYIWGGKKIANELKKINIDIHDTAVNRIISKFRKQGLLQPNGSWKKFLNMHWEALTAWKLTENPSREFVRQQIIDFTFGNNEPKTLILDNVPQFTSIDYRITGVNISPASPNMNAYVERLNGSIRREALDHFLCFLRSRLER